jgi:hypothetical protein
MALAVRDRLDISGVDDASVLQQPFYLAYIAGASDEKNL